MASRRRKAREAALKALYQVDLVQAASAEALDGVIVEEYLRPLLEPFGRELAAAGALAGDVSREEIELFAGEFTNQFLVEFPTGSGDEVAMRDFIARFHRSTLGSQVSEACERLMGKLRDKIKQLDELRGFARDIVERTMEHLTRIDEILSKSADNWSLERMASLDRSILRFATCELLYFPDIPINVTLNEAIELARKFSTERSPEFVNGILDKVHRENKPIKEEPKKRKNAEAGEIAEEKSDAPAGNEE